MDNILSDRALIVDWLMFSTMFVFVRVVTQKPLDDNIWLQNSLYTLLGLAAYHIVSKKVIKNNMAGLMKRVTDTWLKWGTTFTVSRLLSGEPLDNEWMTTTAYVLIGHNVYDVIVHDLVPDDLVKDDHQKQALDNFLYFGTMLVASRLMSGKELDEQWTNESLIHLSGFALYDLVVSKVLN